MNTSDMWVTHGERGQAQLRGPLSSMQTPRASGATGRTPSGKLGSSRRSPMCGDRRWHKPRAWAATEDSPYPFPRHQGRPVREEGWPEQGAWLGEGKGRGSPPGLAPGVLGVCPTWAVAGAGISGRGLRAGTRRGQPSPGGTAAAYPSPAADCGGTERGFEGRPPG